MSRVSRFQVILIVKVDLIIYVTYLAWGTYWQSHYNNDQNIIENIFIRVNLWLLFQIIAGHIYRTNSLV